MEGGFSCKVKNWRKLQSFKKFKPMTLKSKYRGNVQKISRRFVKSVDVGRPVVSLIFQKKSGICRWATCGSFVVPQIKIAAHKKTCENCLTDKITVAWKTY